MATEKPVFFLHVFFMASLLMGIGVKGIRHHHHHRHGQKRLEARYGESSRKLFVFGDSYADTGNLAMNLSPSWAEPYGITFPNKPAGRFSDGRVFTDYVASFLGIKSPIPYKFRKYGQKLLPYGMNFALGGTGVFDTGNLQNNLTVQIDTFKEQIDQGVFSRQDLNSGTAVVSVSGNDYVYYQENGGTMQGLKDFTPKLISQLRVELKRLHDLGVGKVAVTNLHPLGCTPYITSSNLNKECNLTVNLAVMFHNSRLHEAVEELNQDGKDFTFVTINLFDAFMSIIQGNKKFETILKPCCQAVSSEYSCGYVDQNMMKKYTVCEARGSTFYWDSVHPTQAGWTAIFSSLRPSLHYLLN